MTTTTLTKHVIFSTTYYSKPALNATKNDFQSFYIKLALNMTPNKLPNLFYSIPSNPFGK